MNTALEDLQDLPVLANQRFPQEAQLKAAIYGALRENKFKVWFEANYLQTRKKCDLVFIDRNDVEVWIEAKIVAYKNTKCHIKRWDKDIQKLRSFCKAKKLFVLLYFYTHKKNIRRGNMDKIINTDNKKDVLCESDEFVFHWGKRTEDKMKIICWSFN